MENTVSFTCASGPRKNKYLNDTCFNSVSFHFRRFLSRCSLCELSEFVVYPKPRSHPVCVHVVLLSKANITFGAAATSAFDMRRPRARPPFSLHASFDVHILFASLTFSTSRNWPCRALRPDVASRRGGGRGGRGLRRVCRVVSFFQTS